MLTCLQLLSYNRSVRHILFNKYYKLTFNGCYLVVWALALKVCKNCICFYYTLCINICTSCNGQFDQNRLSGAIIKLKTYFYFFSLHKGLFKNCFKTISWTRLICSPKIDNWCKFGRNNRFISGLDTRASYEYRDIQARSITLVFVQVTPKRIFPTID